MVFFLSFFVLYFLNDGQRKKFKKTNNDLQNIHIKPKIELHEPKAGGELRCSGRVGVFFLSFFVLYFLT
jgi:hypothetical protein